MQIRDASAEYVFSLEGSITLCQWKICSVKKKKTNTDMKMNYY